MTVCKTGLKVTHDIQTRYSIEPLPSAWMHCSMLAMVLPAALLNWYVADWSGVVAFVCVLGGGGTHTQALAAKHYAEHDGKPFFPKLVDFLSSGALTRARCR